MIWYYVKIPCTRCEESICSAIMNMTVTHDTSSLNSESILIELPYGRVSVPAHAQYLFLLFEKFSLRIAISFLITISLILSAFWNLPWKCDFSFGKAWVTGSQIWIEGAQHTGVMEFFFVKNPAQVINVIAIMTQTY